jgi:hypothetical protein
VNAAAPKDRRSPPTTPTTAKAEVGSSVSGGRIPRWQREKDHAAGAWVRERLAEADGPSYETLCAEAAAKFGSLTGVRAIRRQMWKGRVISESDQTVWLTPAGWEKLTDGAP